MLVLSRKNDESVVVGGTDGLRGAVKVTVLEIGNGIVRLGFEADSDVPVHREEVWERIRATRPRDPPTGGLDRTESPETRNRQFPRQRQKSSSRRQIHRRQPHTLCPILSPILPYRS